ncbi:hypothetical protein LPN01_12985 [Sphingomonas sp. A2-49]|uniref:hypothetical protein n=1 Tax=Sphingomonas sp. A2-49 TaxID=1391375 RepID=UPI0021D13B01|nr:hypothetical protein [Sphingomonas sp. A2-49]MCU6454994.1 hypothetical protein [Sphingomonas sp. A2-49]
MSDSPAGEEFMAPSHHAYSRIAKRVQAPMPIGHTPWSPPALSDLVARIDAAIDARRATDTH